MYLHELYDHLDLDKSNYARWAKNFLTEFTEGLDYTIETNNHKKKLYNMDGIRSIYILDTYGFGRKRIQEEVNTSSHEFLQKMRPFIGSNYQYFINQVNRLITARNKDIPDDFILPSESAVSYKMMRALELIDNENNIINEDVLLPRPIIKADGNIDYHVIIKESEVSNLLLDYKELMHIELKPTLKYYI